MSDYRLELSPEEEYERNGERLNDIEAHYQDARWDMPEWRQLIDRQRELEKALFPKGDDEAKEWWLCEDESEGEIQRKERDGWCAVSVTPVWYETDRAYGIKWAVAYRKQ